MTNNSDTQNSTALDQLLDMAPPLPPSPQLAKQILSSIDEQRQSAKIIDLKNQTIKVTPRQNNTSSWLIGGLMAASLTIGIWSGTNDFANILVTAPLELAGLSLPQDSDFYTLLDGFTATESLL